MDEETSSIAKIFIGGAALMVLIIIFGLSMGPALEKEEKRECLALQKQASLEGFFLTFWQKQQCDAIGVKINAPVKGGG